jgi:hypothetical protein
MVCQSPSGPPPGKVGGREQSDADGFAFLGNHNSMRHPSLIDFSVRISIELTGGASPVQLRLSIVLGFQAVLRRRLENLDKATPFLYDTSSIVDPPSRRILGLGRHGRFAGKGVAVPLKNRPSGKDSTDRQFVQTREHGMKSAAPLGAGCARRFTFRP